MNRPERAGTRARLLGALGALLFVSTMLVVTRFEVSSDVTNLMPAGSESRLAALARRLTTSEIARTLIVTIGADDPTRAIAGAKEMAAKLRARPDVEAVRSGDEGDVARATYELYFPRRHAFLVDEPAALPARLSDDALAARARAARLALAQPTGMLEKKLLPEDPLGGFQAVLDRLRGLGPQLERVDGQLVTADRRHAVLFVTTRTSAFAGRAQRAFLEDLDETFAGLEANRDGTLEIESAGAARFTVAAERSIRSDVAFVSLLTLIGVTALFVLAFRSLRSLALVGLPLVSGILVATGTSLVVFGKLDGITLGFGASLIGVVVDYPVHLLTHARLDRHASGDYGWLDRIRPGIVLGALTTMASFAGLGLTTIPGLRQLAFFAVVGAAAALAVTLVVLPPFVSDAGPPDRRLDRASAALGRIMRAVGARRGAVALVTLGVLAAACAALPSLRWQDDLAKLWRMDPGLAAEDQRVHARVGQGDDGRLLVVLAPDVETGLARNDAVAKALEAARANGAVGGYRSLHALLFAAETQRANERGVRADPTLALRVRRAYAEAGFRPEAFAPFEQALAAPPPPPLTLEALDASPLGALARNLVVPLDDGVALLTHVRDVRDEDALAAAAAAAPDAYAFHPARFLNDVFAQLRATTFQQIAVGYALVIVLVVFRYKRARPALAAVVPSLLVTVLLLGGASAAGLELNLLHVVSLDMVIGMGVDYSVFLVDAKRHGEELGATVMSLVLCCLTTVFTFGMMALSVHPALSAVGITVGAGVLLSLVCAPVSLLLLGDEVERG